MLILLFALTLLAYWPVVHCGFSILDDPDYVLRDVYAAAGRFPEAITVAQETQRVALAAGNQDVADAAAARLELYRAGHPYQQPSP